MKSLSQLLDEAELQFNSESDPQKKVEYIINFVVVYGDSFNDQIAGLLDKCINYCREINYKEGESIAYFNLLFFHNVTLGNLKSQYLSKIPPVEELEQNIVENRYWHGIALSLKAYVYWFKGEYEKGFNAAFHSLKEFENSPGTILGWVYFALGVFYFDTKDFENSRTNYQRACDSFMGGEDWDKFGGNWNEYGIARARTGIGSALIALNQPDEALPELEYALNIYEKLSHHSGYSRAVNDLGILQKNKKNYPKAIEYLKDSIRIREEISHYQGLITSYTELGEVYLWTNELDEAEKVFYEGLKLAVDIKSLQKETRLHKLLYDIAKKRKDNEKALFHFEKFYEGRSTLLSDEATNNIKKLQSQFEKQKAEQEAEIERLRNVELKQANDIIEQKNKDITDSINYARRIQFGILPSNELLDRSFSDYFILYQPKDIVSGDFYWVIDSEDRDSGNKLSIIAAIDCTGHGVPGAFMSVLGNTLLNQTIHNPDVRSAADVLNYLNAKLPENFKSVEKDSNIHDGMDMALCIFDWKNNLLQFAGANNPCWIIRNKEIIEYDGTKQPVSASFTIEKKPFVNDLIPLQKGDCIYIFTDGFADQFGGPKEKKFGYKRLRELLLSVNNLPMNKQREALLNALIDWKQNLEQIDDVCVIGIRM